jgi:hypothetical protein
VRTDAGLTGHRVDNRRQPNDHRLSRATKSTTTTSAGKGWPQASNHEWLGRCGPWRRLRIKRHDLHLFQRSTHPPSQGPHRLAPEV